MLNHSIHRIRCGLNNFISQWRTAFTACAINLKVDKMNNNNTLPSEIAFERIADIYQRAICNCIKSKRLNDACKLNAIATKAGYSKGFTLPISEMLKK